MATSIPKFRVFPPGITGDALVQVSVDGRKVEVLKGSTVLDCINAASLSVPSLCHDPRLAPVGACRLCLVEIAGQSRPLPACVTPAASGMQIQTETPELLEYRNAMLKLLAAKYPAQTFSTPTNDLSLWFQTFGITPQGHCSDSVDDSTPYLHVDMSRCIQCFRCVRICSEVQGQFVWNIRNRGVATRIVPDSNNLASGSCVSCGACVDTCPTGAISDKKILETGSPTNWTRTVCPYCGTGCEIYAGTRDERLVAIKPALDGAVNKGHACSKGRYAFEFVDATDRIREPMLRRNGTWLKVSWDEAIRATTDALRSAIGTYGPDSVAMLGSARATNEEAYLAQKFARVVVGTNNVDCCARVCHAPSAAALKEMLGTGAATNSFDDIERAGTMLICGCNPTENHPVLGARIKQAALHGTHLIVIDPRQIELSKFADIHLQIRPGTNIPLLNGMASAIVEEGLFDAEFVQNRIDNWEAFAQFVQRYRPEVVSELCGVEANLIRQAARVYAKHRPSMCFHGLGVTEHTQGTEGVMCLANLALITGNIGKTGSGINPLRGQNNVQGAAHMGCDPNLLPGSIPLKTGARLFEKVWKAEIPDRNGLNLLQMMDAAENGNLKLLWSIGYDALLTNPNKAVSQRAFSKLATVIVQDMFLNETARQFGTIFLPACSSFEKGGTFMNAERRVQRIRQVLSPRGSSKPDWEILCSVAKVMGKGDCFSFTSPRDIWEEIRAVWPGGAGISYDRLDYGGLQWPCPADDHPGTQILHQDTFASAKRAPLQCVEFKQSPEMGVRDYPLTLITGRTLQQFNAGTMTGRGGHKTLRATDLLDVSPVDAQRMGIADGDDIRLCSRYGRTVLPIHITDTVASGQLFATFHDPTSALNYVTGPFCDNRTSTPEYKITAVRLEKISSTLLLPGYDGEPEIG